MLDHIVVEVSMIGPLTEEQRDALLAVAHKCPVHRTLTSEIKIAVRAVAS
jgi:putative redox protein